MAVSWTGGETRIIGAAIGRRQCRMVWVAFAEWGVWALEGALDDAPFGRILTIERVFGRMPRTVEEELA